MKSLSTIISNRFKSLLSKAKYSLAAIALALPLGAEAQRARLITTEEGLSSGKIQHIMEDNEGNIWISTECGLDKYNASVIRHYHEQQGDTTKIGSNFVRRTFQASDGSIYVCTMRGLSRYDKLRDKFTPVHIIDNDNVNHTSFYVTSIVETPQHGIVFGTSGFGVYQMPVKGSLTAHHMKEVKCRYVTALYCDNKQRLWICSSSDEFFCIGTSGRLEKFSINGANRKAKVISCIMQDKFGKVFFGTIHQGLFYFDDTTRAIELVKGTEKLRIADLYNDTYITGKKQGNIISGDRLLIGTDGMGIYQMRPGSDEVEPVNNLWLPIPMRTSKALSIMRDRNGNLWLGLNQRGVGLFPYEGNPFHYYGQYDRNTDIIGYNPVLAVLGDSRSNIWVATERDALYRINPDGKSSQRYSMSDDGTELYSVTTVHEDQRGNIWIGTTDKGLLFADGKTGKITAFKGSIDGNPWNVAIISSIIDDEFGNLWVGTDGEGLYRINLATGQVVRIKGKGDNVVKQGALSNQWITSLCATGDGLLWIGSYYGLDCLDIRKMSIKSEGGVLDKFKGEVVTCITNARADGLWVGTFHGITNINGSKEKTLTTANGLPNNVVQSAVIDHNGDLWVGTNSGLAFVRKGTDKALMFKSSLGARINEYVRGAASVCNDGRLIFGGLTGIKVFSPDVVIDNVKKPVLRISGIYLNGEPVNGDTYSGSYLVCDAEPNEVQTVNLAHDENSLVIQFTHLDYLLPEDGSYAYSINGKEWIQLEDGVKDLQLRNLASGTYKIRMKCIAHNIDSDIREITVVVHAAWYNSIFAWIIYVLLIIALVVWMVRSYNATVKAKAIERQNQRELEASRSKLNLLINISHEIRTPMSMILSPAEQLIASDGNSVRRHYYDVIYNGAKRIMNLVSQMLDTSKIEEGKLQLTYHNINITRYVEEICSYMDAACEQKSIALTFQSLAQDSRLWIDPDHFDKIIINLISNAIKFTPEGGHITVVLNQQEKEGKQFVEIVVTDNGCGIPEGAHKLIFDRFYQVSNDNKNKVNESHLGTGIGLNLCLMLVQLHGGTIVATDNPEESGSRFTILIPMGNDHILPIHRAEDDPEKEDARFKADIPTNALADSDAASGKPTGSGKVHVLFVDDDDDLRKFLTDELSSEFHVTTCANGSEAWQSLLREKPDIILTDVMMPVMDGIELCRKIRQNINVNSLPVVMLTASESEDHHLRGLDMGADAYISKPFTMPVLFSTLRNVLRSRQMLCNCFEGRQNNTVEMPEVANQPSHDEKLMQRIIKVLEENISKPDLNVEMLARESGLSRVHLYRKLKELTNQSPSDFIRQIRLKKAAELLRQGNYNISEIANLMGFSSLAVFSRAFKDFYGVSPKEFK